MSGETMTARELRNLLNTLSEEELDLPLATQGCDCNGEAYNITVDSYDVTINRWNGGVRCEIIRFVPRDNEVERRAQERETAKKRERWARVARGEETL